MEYAEFVGKLAAPMQNPVAVAPEALIDFGLSPLIAAGKDLDGAKKKLFYNKPDRLWDTMHDHTREHPPLSYDCVKVDTLHALVGICTEAAELAELLLEALEQRRDVDVDKVILEAGDLGWYVQLLANALGVPVATFQERNIEKLRKRFGETFSPEKAIARADVPDAETVAA